MKKMKKIILAMLACSFVGVMAVGVTACGGGNGEDSAKDSVGHIEKTPPSEGLEYELSEDGTYYTVVGIGTCTDTDLVVPSVYNELPVEEIAEMSFVGEGITSIYIPDSVEYIGEMAFALCDSLKNIEVAEKNTEYSSIDGNLYTKDSTTLLCYAYGKKEKTFMTPDSVKQIGSYSFYDCASLEHIVIGDSVECIEEYAFDNAPLRNVEVGDNVKTIEENAFYNCVFLTDIVLGESVTSIEKDAFRNCFRLVEIYNKSALDIVLGAETHGKIAFYGEAVYTQAYESKLSTDENGFIFYTDGEEVSLVGCTEEKAEVVIPDNVTKIRKYAFYGCSELTNLEIGANVKEIGEEAFTGCYYLAEVYNKSSLEIVAGAAENGNVAYYAENVYTEEYESKLFTDENGFVLHQDGEEVALVKYMGTEKDIVIPDSVTRIRGNAFRDDYNITSVVIPDSVTSIGAYAFEDCLSLKRVVMSKNVTSIGAYAFAFCLDLTEFELPETLTSIGEYAFCYCSSLTNLAIPASLTSISMGAFSGWESLTSLTIPDTVTTIYRSAFFNCENLETVFLGKNLTSIDPYALAYCFALTNIEVDEENTAYTAIEGNLYTKDGKTLVLYAMGKADTSFVVPDNVTTIGDYAFVSASNLTSVEIPVSVTKISFGAFYLCNNLEEVYYQGSASDWEGIVIDNEEEGNHKLINATKYYYSETQPTDEGNYWHFVDGVVTKW